MEASYNESIDGSNGQDQDDLMTFYSKDNELLMGISFLSLAVIGKKTLEYYASNNCILHRLYRKYVHDTSHAVPPKTLQLLHSVFDQRFHQ